MPSGSIQASEVPDELEAQKVYLQGLSRNGSPVVVIKGNKHFPPKDVPQFKSNLFILTKQKSCLFLIVWYVMSKVQ